MISPASEPPAKDIREFRSGSLTLQYSLSPHSRVLEEFYRGYDEAFVLPNEKEELAGFRECLALNFGEDRRRLVAQYGEFHEVVMVAREREAADPDAVIGGANFICYPLRDRERPMIAMNLNYIYVASSARRRGYFGKLLDSVRVAARALCDDRKGVQPVLIFLEQNDPLRMDRDAYALDTAHSGLDQRQRIGIWARQGARIVDFAYVQPALSPDQGSDDTLVYALIGAESAGLSACLLRDHLARFFGISVLKGRAIAEDAAASAQIAALSRQCEAGDTIALLDPAPWLAGESSGHGFSLRDTLKQNGLSK